jgi:hypothetical protein
LLIVTLKFFRGYKRLAGIITAVGPQKLFHVAAFPENEETVSYVQEKCWHVCDAIEIL